MKTIYYFILTIIVFLAAGCNLSTKTNKSEQETDSLQSDSISMIASDSTLLIDIDTDEEFANINYFDNYSYKGIQIFANAPHIQDGYINQLFEIMDTIVGLFEVNNEFRLKECLITKVNVFDNPCGYVQIEPTLNLQYPCHFLFRGLKTFNKGDLKTVSALSNVKVWVGDAPLHFRFSNVDYTLRSEGVVINSQGEGDKKMARYKKI